MAKYAYISIHSLFSNHIYIIRMDDNESKLFHFIRSRLDNKIIVFIYFLLYKNKIELKQKRTHNIYIILYI